MKGIVLRATSGFLVSPMIIPFTIWVVYSLCYLVHVPGFAAYDYSTVRGWASTMSFIAVVIGYLITIVFAVPGFVLFRRRGWSKGRHYLTLGACLGALPFVAYDVYALAFDLICTVSMGWRHSFFGIAPTFLRVVHQLPVATGWLGLGASCGISVSMLFWLIAVRDRKSGSLAT